MSVTTKDRGHQSRKRGEKVVKNPMLEILEEAKRDKESLTYSLIKKAFNADNPDLGTIYYIMASFLRRGRVIPYGPFNIMGTDGRNFYVGYMYKAVKREYGIRIVPFLWLHELMHIIHNHPTRMKLVEDQNLYNIIADLYVNTLLSNRFGKIPDEFVTLQSFIYHVIDVLGKKLSDNERRTLESLAKMVVKEEITVEDAYEVISKIKPVSNKFKMEFENSSFFGKDMANIPQEADSRDSKSSGNKKSQPETGKGNRGTSDKTGEEKGKRGETGNDNNVEGKKKSGGTGEKEPDTDKKRSTGAGAGNEEGELTDNKRAERLEEILKELKERVDEVMGEVKRSKGEFNAIMREFGKEAGNEAGVFGRIEYRELQGLRVSLEDSFLSDVGRVLREYEINYSRFSREAYWLPESRELYFNKIKVFLDTSGSIPYNVAVLFMNWVRKAMRKYGVEVELVTFAVGRLEKRKLTTESKLKYVPRGSGTVWDKTIAEEFIKAVREEVPVVIVLSDMLIEMKREAREAIKFYKRKGGKIICWTTHSNSSICNITHRFPKILLHR